MLPVDARSQRRAARAQWCAPTPPPNTTTPATGAGYVQHTPAWRAALPGVRPVTLTASICFLVPLLRDLISWMGVRVVHRRTFVAALRQRRAVLVCPGGQAELCLTHRLHSAAREYSVYRGHKGG